MTSETRQATDSRPSTPLGDTLRRGVREASGVWWWYLILGVAWIWYGMFVPAGTPPAIVRKIYDATVAAMKQPSVKATLARDGTAPLPP